MAKRKINPKRKLPKDPQALIRLWTAAMGQMGHRQWPEALDSFQRFLDAEPGLEMQAVAYSNMANIYMDMGDFDKAMSSWRKAADLEPYNPIYLIGQGLTHACDGRVAEAAALLRDVRASFGDPSTSQLVDSILSDIQPEIEGNAPPGNFYYQRLMNLFSRYIELGDWEFTAETARRMIALDDQRPEGHFNLGVILQRQEQFAAAAAKMEEARRREPEHAGTLCNLGLCHFNLGDYEQALKWLTQAREIAPKDVLAARLIGEVYQKMGNADRAISIWQKALRRAPDNEALQELLFAAGAGPELVQPVSQTRLNLQEYGPKVKAQMRRPRVCRSGEVALTVDAGRSFVLEDAGNIRNGTVYSGASFDMGSFTKNDILTFVGVMKLTSLQANIHNVRELLFLAYYPDGDVFSYVLRLVEEDGEEWLETDSYGRLYTDKVPTFFKVRADTELTTDYGPLNGYFIYLNQGGQPGVIVSTWGHMKPGMPRL